MVPGVSSLTAVPEYAGIDLIHAGGVHFASVTDGKFNKVNTSQWGMVPTVVVSTVVSMIAGLVEAARPPAGPMMTMCWPLHGGSTEQVTITTTLAELVTAVRAVGRRPATRARDHG